MITPEYMEQLRLAVERANDRYESNPTYENEFKLKLYLTSYEARLRAYHRFNADGLSSPDSHVQGVEPCRAHGSEYMGEGW